MSKVVEQDHGNRGPHWSGNGDMEEDPQDNKTICVYARSLNITWGSDKRFWQWLNATKESPEVAELLQVNWIEITQKFDLSLCSKLHPSTTYEVYYIVKFKEDAFGWHSVPIKFKVKVNGDENERSEILEPYRQSQDNWIEIPGGEFTVPANKAGTLELGMYEVDSDWWKGSMLLKGLKLKPKT